MNDEDWKVHVGELAHSSIRPQSLSGKRSDHISVIFRERNEKVLPDLKLIPCVLKTKFENERFANGLARKSSSVRVGMLVQ